MNSEKYLEIEIHYKKNYIHEDLFENYKSNKWKLNLNKSLKDNLTYFYISNGIKRKEKMFFYIVNNGNPIQEIDINQPLKTMINELKDNKILISSNKYKVNNNIKIYKKIEGVSGNSERENIQNPPKIFNIDNSEGFETISKKKRFCFLAKIFIPIIIALIGLAISLNFLLKNKKKSEIIIKQEELMANINYKKGLVYLYKSEEKSEVISKKENEVNTTNFIEYKNYLLLILEENNEQLNDLKRIYYTGIFSLTSSYIKNETHLMLTQSDDKVNEILPKVNKNLRRAKDNNYIDYHKDNITNPFFKIEFYKNGIIRNIYIPDGFDNNYMTSMKALLNLTIPKLTNNFYVNNVEDHLNKEINQKNNEEEEEDEKNEEGNRFRYLNMSEDNDSNGEQILSPPSDNNELDAYVDLMQIEKINNEKNENISKITELLLNNINNEYATMEGGTTNTTRTFYINEDKGNLVKIEENSILFLDNKKDEDEMEDSIKFDNANDNNNLLKNNDIIKNQTKNSNNKKYIKPDFILNTTKNVNILDPVNEPNIFRKLSNHFNSFKYSEFNNQNLRLLFIKNESSDGLNIEIVNPKIRKTENYMIENKYYGMDKVIDQREITSEDIMGIKMKQWVASELDPSTGIVRSYVIINLGNYNYKVNFPQYQTNLNIIIQNINLFAYSLIELILKTNSELKETIEVITVPIRNIGIETMSLLRVNKDFSNIDDIFIKNIIIFVYHLSIF